MVHLFHFEEKNSHLYPFVFQNYENINSDIKKDSKVATVMNIGISLIHMPSTLFIFKLENWAIVNYLEIISSFHIWNEITCISFCSNILELARGWQN